MCRNIVQISKRYIKPSNVIKFVYHFHRPGFNNLIAVCKERDHVKQSLTISKLFFWFAYFIYDVPYIFFCLHSHRIVFVSNRESNHRIGEASINITRFWHPKLPTPNRKAQPPESFFDGSSPRYSRKTA